MKQKHETILARWLRLATPPERDRLASLAGTETNYLYQLAACRREPKVGLAVRLAQAAKEVHREGLPTITVDDLASMWALEGL